MKETIEQAIQRIDKRQHKIADAVNEHTTWIKKYKNILGYGSLAIAFYLMFSIASALWRWLS